MIGELAAQGKAVLFVSSYLPELLGVCDRLAVMARGQLSPVRPAAEWTPEAVMAYATGSGSDNLDLWTMPAPPASGEPKPFLEGDGAQAQGQFSPDGRWVAYVSDESGRPEVYVRRFQSGGDRWQISSNGGAQPRWRADGREIFYVSTSGTLMAVPVSADNGELIAGTAVALFTEPSLRINSSVFFYGGAAAYDVDRDGRRQPDEGEQGAGGPSGDRHLRSV